MPSPLKVEWRSVGGEVVRQEIKKQNQLLEQQGKHYKETAAQARSLDREAQRMIRNNLSPMEKWKQESARVVQVFQTMRGVTRDLAQKELRRLKEQYLGTGEAARKALADQKAMAREAQGVIQSLETDQERYNREVLRLGKLLRAGAITQDQFVAASRKAKSEMISNADALREAAEAEKRREQVTRESAQVIRSLETSQEKYNRELEELKRLYREGGLTQQQFIESSKRLKAATLESGAAARKALADQKEAAREAQGVIQSLETDQERYNREVLRLGKLLRAGTISQEQFAAAARKAKFEMLGGAQAAREAEAAQQAMAAAGESITRRNEQPLERYKRQYRELVKVYRSGELSLRDKRREVARLRGELNEAGRAGKSAFGAAMQNNLKGFLLTTFGIGGAIAGVREEIMKLRAAREQGVETQSTVAGARRQLKLGIASTSPEQEKSILAKADSLAADLNLPQNLVDDTIRAAISASPTAERGVKFAEAGLKTIRDSGGVDDFVGGTIDVANALNTDDPELAQGFILAALRRARVQDPKKFSQNAPRVIQTGNTLGLSPQESIALFNALTVGGADPFGEVSRTGAINVLDRAGKFFSDERLLQEGIKREDADTVGEQLKLFLTNPELAEEFTKSGGFRAAGIGGIRGLFQDLDGEARKTFELTLQDLSSEQRVKEIGAGVVGRLNRGKEEATKQANDAVKSGREQFLRGNRTVLSEEREADLTRTVAETQAALGGGFLGFNTQALQSTQEAQLLASAGFEVTAQEGARFAEEQAFLLEQQGLQSGARDPQRVQEGITKLREMARALREAAALADDAAGPSSPPTNPQQE